MIDELSEEQRRQAVAWAIALTVGTTLAPDQYERELLHEYTLGQLNLTQVLDQLDNRIQHILYRSQANHPFTHSQLTELQKVAQAENESNQITGLLCYSREGHFVQVIEGPSRAVHALYAKIKLDQHHSQVTLLSDKASSKRWFADWRMALVNVPTNEYYWLLGYLESKTHNLITPQLPIDDPRLLTLLQQFSQS